MAFSPLENFRNFLSSRPPLVVFVVCIGMMAIAFVSFAFYIKYNDVYNPDANEKLNEFLDNITKLNLCVESNNESWIVPDRTEQNLNLSKVFLKAQHPFLSDISSLETASFVITTDVRILTSDAHSFPRPVTNFVSVFPGYLLGVSGPKENDSVAIKMTPGNPVKLTCSTGKQCHIAYQMCLTVAAPMGFIPYARQSSKCTLDEANSTIPHVSWLNATLPVYDENGHFLHACNSNVFMELSHTREKLTVMMTLEKRSIVNMHLMHSSYFLFVIVITVLLFGIITGGGDRKHSKNHMNHYTMMNSS